MADARLTDDRSQDAEFTLKEKVSMWVGIAGGSWIGALYWALFGWIGGVAVAGAMTIITGLYFAYFLGGDDA